MRKGDARTHEVQLSSAVMQIDKTLCLNNAIIFTTRDDNITRCAVTEREKGKKNMSAEVI